MIGIAKPVRKYAGYALLGLVAVAPLPFGAVAPWAWASFALLCGVMLLCVALPTTIDYGAPVASWRGMLWPALLCGGALGWALFQFSPWPLEWQHPIWAVTSDILGIAHGAISLSPSVGMQIITRWLMYAAVFVLAFIWGHDARRNMLALNTLVVAGTIYALYGLVMIFIGSNYVLWIDKPSYWGDVTGVFINKNNFASYAGALLCIAIGLLLRRIMHDVAGAGAREFWRRLITVLIGRAWYLTVSVVILFTALLLTHSRAGLVSFVIGFVVLLFLLRLAVLLRGKMFFWGAGFMIFVLFGIFLFSGEGVFSRMVSDGEIARPQIYELALNALADRPWLGNGLGSFPQIFQIYRTEDMPVYFTTERAHSVYLENMVELGIPAALALFGGVVLLFWRTAVSVTADERHRTVPAVCAAAMVVMGTHSFIDFPLQIPAISMLFAYLLGLGCAQARA